MINALKLSRFLRKIIKNLNFKQVLSLAGSAFTCASAGYALKEYFDSSGRIIENGIYTVEQAAEILKISHEEADALVKSGKIQGRMFNTGYRILGRNLLDYLK